jgi:hypothetical protein
VHPDADLQPYMMLLPLVRKTTVRAELASSLGVYLLYRSSMEVLNTRQVVVRMHRSALSYLVELAVDSTADNYHLPDPVEFCRMLQEALDPSLTTLFSQGLLFTPIKSRHEDRARPIIDRVIQTLGATLHDHGAGFEASVAFDNDLHYVVQYSKHQFVAVLYLEEYARSMNVPIPTLVMQILCGDVDEEFRSNAIGNQLRSLINPEDKEEQSRAIHSALTTLKSDVADTMSRRWRIARELLQNAGEGNQLYASSVERPGSELFRLLGWIRSIMTLTAAHVHRRILHDRSDRMWEQNQLDHLTRESFRRVSYLAALHTNWGDDYDRNIDVAQDQFFESESMQWGEQQALYDAQGLSLTYALQNARDVLDTRQAANKKRTSHLSGNHDVLRLQMARQKLGGIDVASLVDSFRSSSMIGEDTATHRRMQHQNLRRMSEMVPQVKKKKKGEAPTGRKRPASRDDDDDDEERAAARRTDAEERRDRLGDGDVEMADEEDPPSQIFEYNDNDEDE